MLKRLGHADGSCGTTWNSDPGASPPCLGLSKCDRWRAPDSVPACSKRFPAARMEEGQAIALASMKYSNSILDEDADGMQTSVSMQRVHRSAKAHVKCRKMIHNRARGQQHMLGSSLWASCPELRPSATRSNSAEAGQLIGIYSASRKFVSKFYTSLRTTCLDKC